MMTTLPKTTICAKAINEALSIQRANLDILREKRGGIFLIEDVKPYMGIVESLNGVEGQEKIVLSLYKKSIQAHYAILRELTKEITRQDEPYLEHLQTPALLEILYEQDPNFRNFVKNKFLPELSSSKSKAIIIKEGEKKYTGAYGPTCALDFALTPGSTSNVLNQIMQNISLSDESGKGERYYADTVLASKAFGMNTPYCFGWKFLEGLKNNKTKEETAATEVNIFSYIFDEPTKANKKILSEVNFSSFDPEKYMSEYKAVMEKTAIDAISAGVHYGNIVSIPALATGDIGHHLSQSVYDLCKDDLIFSILEAITEITGESLKKLISDSDSESLTLGKALSVATGSAAVALVHILESEGFTSEMITKFLIQRFKNFVKENPFRGAALELHSVDFMDILHRGSKILHEKEGKLENIQIDLSPLTKRGIIRNPENYIYPNFGMSSRFSALMNISDHLCLFNLEPLAIYLLTNMISLAPDKPIAPIKSCKNCAVSSVMAKEERCDYCGLNTII